MCQHLPKGSFTEYNPSLKKTEQNWTYCSTLKMFYCSLFMSFFGYQSLQHPYTTKPGFCPAQNSWHPTESRLGTTNQNTPLHSMTAQRVKARNYRICDSLFFLLLHMQTGVLITLTLMHKVK